MPDTPRRTALYFTIDADLHDALRAIAKSRGMLMNAYARQLIVRHIQRVADTNDSVAPV